MSGREETMKTNPLNMLKLTQFNNKKPLYLNPTLIQSVERLSAFLREGGQECPERTKLRLGQTDRMEIDIELVVETPEVIFARIEELQADKEDKKE